MADKTSPRSQDPPASKPKSTYRLPHERRSQPDGSGPPPFRFGPLSWLILALLIVWNAWAFMPHKSVEVSLPYSEFVQQVTSGNVTAVSIVGSAITGRLAHPLIRPRDYSEATAARVDREVASLLTERQSVVLRLLSAARGHLDALVETLLREETIGEEQLTRILGPRPTAEAPPKAERQPGARSSLG